MEVALQVGTALEQRQDWKRPEDLVEKQFVGRIPLELSPSDLSGQIVAALVSGALAMFKHKKIDSQATFRFVRSTCHRLARRNVSFAQAF
jgi:hypothetical protein